MTAVEAAQWFPTDVLVAGEEFNAVELAFAAVLRARAAAWPAGDLRISSCLSRPDRSDALLAIVVIVSRGYSAHYNGTSVRGDAPQGDPYFPLPNPPTRWAMKPAAGQVEELANHTADWFESLLRRHDLLGDPT